MKICQFLLAALLLVNTAEARMRFVRGIRSQKGRRVLRNLQDGAPMTATRPPTGAPVASGSRSMSAISDDNTSSGGMSAMSASGDSGSGAMSAMSAKSGTSGGMSAMSVKIGTSGSMSMIMSAMSGGGTGGSKSAMRVMSGSVTGGSKSVMSGTGGSKTAKTMSASGGGSKSTSKKSMSGTGSMSMISGSKSGSKGSKGSKSTSGSKSKVSGSASGLASAANSPSEDEDSDERSGSILSSPSIDEPENITPGTPAPAPGAPTTPTAPTSPAPITPSDAPSTSPTSPTAPTTSAAPSSDGAQEACQEDETTVVEVAQSDDQFSTLVELLTKAGLVDALSGDGPFTVFAPTNAAFAALGQEIIDGSSDERLAEILTYHVITATVLSTDLVDGAEVTTLNSATVTTFTDPPRVRDANGNDANIVAADIPACNGVVHVIDAVLIPPEAPVTTDAPIISGPGNIGINITIDYNVRVDGVAAPTEAELANLETSTIEFFEEILSSSFPSLESSNRTDFANEKSAQGWLTTYTAELDFSAAPTTEQIVTVIEEADYDNFIRNFVWPTGPYFAQTIGLDLTAGAVEIFSS